jgi:ABC-type multidrug transport system fused ATPase/permease subunit
MPVTYLKESIVTAVSWIKVCTIFNLFNFLLYFVLFYLPGFSNFFSLADAAIPIYGGLMIPQIFCIIGGVVFTTSTDENYSFPMVMLNGINLVAHLVLNLTLVSSRLKFCADPIIVNLGSCNVGYTVLLVVAFILFVLSALWSFISIMFYIRFSQSIDENVTMMQWTSGAYNKVNREIDGL